MRNALRLLILPALLAALFAPSVTAGEATNAIVILPAGPQVPAGLEASLAGWRAGGLVTDTMWLDSVPQKEPGFSALLIIGFAGETAWRKWRDGEAARLPAGTRVRRVDALVHGERADYDPRPALFEVNVYGVKTTTARYREYSGEYITPLMQGQMEPGYMGWYTMYVEQGDDSGRYAVLVKAYRDPATYEGIAPYKLQLRERLATHPTYPKWHAIKGTLRDDLTETLARARISR